MLLRQHVVYLTFMNYAILSLQLMPKALSVARRDLWLSFLLSSIVGFAIAWGMWRVERKYPGQTLIQIMATRAHPFVRTAVFLVLSLYTFVLTVLTTAQVSAFINIGFLQETPCWVISILFMASVAYALRKGLMSIANLAGLLTFVTVVSGLTMTVALTGNRHTANLLPIGEYGFPPILMGTLLCLPIWVELFFISLLPRKGIGRKGWLSTYLFIVAVNTLVIVGHDVSPVTTFGLEQALNLNYPMLSAVKTISLGFVDRFDVYGLALMMFGSYVRASLYLVMTLLQLQAVWPVVKRRNSWFVILPTVAMVCLGSVFSFHDAPTFYLLSQTWFAYAAILALCLCVCLFAYLGFTGRFSYGRPS